jgi:hypothetical protein
LALSNPFRAAPLTESEKALQATLDKLAPVGTDVAKPWSGTGSAGTDDNPSSQDHVHPAALWTPSSSSFKGWTDNPLIYTGAAAPTSGTVYVMRVRLDTTGTISMVTILVTTAGTGLSNCYAGVYDTSGVQLGISADQSASWNSTGTKAVSLTSATTSQSAGTDLYVALLYNGSALALRSATAAPIINLWLTRQGTAGTSQTALPSPLGSVPATTTPYFVAVN